LTIIFIIGVLYTILAFNEQELYINIVLIVLYVLLFLGIIYTMFMNIQFEKDKVIINMYIYTEHNEYKNKFVKGPVIYYDNINRIDYQYYKDKRASMNIVKIELKDNNKNLIININAYTKSQQNQIKWYFNNIFKLREDK
jgi:flagellar basal body-associated protein FliL